MPTDSVANLRQPTGRTIEWLTPPEGGGWFWCCGQTNNKGRDESQGSPSGGDTSSQTLGGERLGLARGRQEKLPHLTDYTDFQ